jgi:hypothetical protein
VIGDETEYVQASSEIPDCDYPMLAFAFFPLVVGGRKIEVSRFFEAQLSFAEIALVLYGVERDLHRLDCRPFYGP